MTETELQDAVIECAQMLQWRVVHFRPARVKRGDREIYETPIAADGKGFPDLCMVNPRLRRILFVELKNVKGETSAEQEAWLGALSAATGETVSVDLWRPEDWMSGHIERVLRGLDVGRGFEAAA